MSRYQTKHIGFAAFVRFVCGDDHHLSTTRDDSSGLFLFVFDDEPVGHCRELADQFFGDDGAAVADARALLDCLRDIKKTIIQADRSPQKMWNRDDVAGETV